MQQRRTVGAIADGVDLEEGDGEGEDAEGSHASKQSGSKTKRPLSNRKS